MRKKIKLPKPVQHLVGFASTDRPDPVSDSVVDRLHEAICEGRKQDAIDMLNRMFPSANLRSASAQNSLFPNRVIS